MSENELCFLRSTELAAKLRRREVSAVEVTEAHLKQIERVNPKVNAIVTLVPEQALEAAKKPMNAWSKEKLQAGCTDFRWPIRIWWKPRESAPLMDHRFTRTMFRTSTA